MGTKGKENNNSLKRRYSKKSKKSSEYETEKKTEDHHRQPDIGNVVDNVSKEEQQRKVYTNTPITKSPNEIESRKVPVKITSSFTNTKLEPMPNVPYDATEFSTELQLAAGRKQDSQGANEVSNTYSFSIPDEEEIECLKEDTEKDNLFKQHIETKTENIVSKQMNNRDLSENIEIRDPVQALSDTKPTISGLEKEGISDTLRDYDYGKINFNSAIESENNKPIADKAIQLESLDIKQSKPTLPLDDASEAWMNDDVGMIESDSDDEVLQENIEVIGIKESIIPIDNIKPNLSTLPLDEVSEVLMENKVGTIYSVEEDEHEEKVQHTSKDNKSCATVLPMLPEASKEIKSKASGLPLDDASEAWMDDDIGIIYSDSEDEVLAGKIEVVQNVQKETEINVEEKVPEAPTGITPKASGLPLDNASEAWMDDDVGIIDSDSEEEAIHGDIGVVENKENVQQARQIKVDETDTKVSRNIVQDIVPQRSATTKSGNSCLTLEDTSEAWMDDDVGTIDSDSED